MDRLFLHYFYINYTGKRSGADSKCAICIWKLLLWTHILQSRELSIQAKQTIVRLQKQNQSIKEIARTSGVSKSTVWYILRKKKNVLVSDINSPGRPRRKTVVDDRRSLSMVKKNPFTTSSQEKNTFQEVDMPLSKSIISRLPVALGYSLVMMWPKTSSRKNSEAYRDILSAQIQSNGQKLNRRRFIVQMDDDPKHTAKARVFEGKKVEYSALAKSISWSQPDWARISLAEDKTKDRKTHEQKTTEVSLSKAWQSITKKKTPSLVMSMSSRLKEVIACKLFSKQILKRNLFIWFIFVQLHFNPWKWGVFV